MIAEKNKPVQHVVDDVHELTMHSRERLLAAMSAAGLRGRFIRDGKTGRGLYVAVKPR
jgi:hypothetical protein